MYLCLANVKYKFMFRVAVLKAEKSCKILKNFKAGMTQYEIIEIIII